RLFRRFTVRAGTITPSHPAAHSEILSSDPPADISGRSIPARGRGRLSLLRRRDSDAFLVARVGDIRDGLHVALGNNRKKLALRSTRRNLLCPAPAGLLLGGLGPGACSPI